MRVYHTCRPEQQATEFTIAPSGITEAITKLAWMPDENLVVIGQRSGKVQLWDVRTHSGPAISTVVSKGGAVIQDLEINPSSNTILLATDDRVSLLATRRKLLYYYFESSNVIFHKNICDYFTGCIS